MNYLAVSHRHQTNGLITWNVKSGRSPLIFHWPVSSGRNHEIHVFKLRFCFFFVCFARSYKFIVRVPSQTNKITFFDATPLVRGIYFCVIPYKEVSKKKQCIYSRHLLCKTNEDRRRRKKNAIFVQLFEIDHAQTHCLDWTAITRQSNEKPKKKNQMRKRRKKTTESHCVGSGQDGTCSIVSETIFMACDTHVLSTNQLQKHTQF